MFPVENVPVRLGKGSEVPRNTRSHPFHLAVVPLFRFLILQVVSTAVPRFPGRG